MKNELQYIFLAQTGKDHQEFSLNFTESDYIANETILNSLIGTLVKYNKEGQIAPYLAKSYDVSDNGKVWRYKLLPNLKCEDGTPITAKSYHERLLWQLREYSKKSSPIDFNLLVGFEDFKNNKSQEIKGFKFINDEIIFEFSKRPEDLNEMLRMPYFGFWCLNESNKLDISTFISSGPYKVMKSSSLRKLSLEKRKDWFSVSEKSFDKITFSFKNQNDFNSNIEFIESAIIIDTSTRVDIHNPILINQKQFQSTPSNVSNLILSPYYSGVFSKIENRRYVLNKIRELQNYKSEFDSKFFYKNNESLVVEDKIENFDKEKYQSFKVGYLGEKTKKILETEKILKSILNNQNIETIFESDNNRPGWWMEVQNNKMYDVRLGSVAAGTRMRNFVVKMIFCTDLGARYPDPSGKICKLVDEYDRLEKNVDDEYIQRFNQALYDDACVIPLYHFGRKWIMSSNIDENTFTPTVELPKFEDIFIKDAR